MRLKMNADFLSLWMEACEKEDIKMTPILPIFEPETLTPMEFRVDGTKLVNKTGFQYKYTYTPESLRVTLEHYINNKTWPKSLGPV